MIEKNNKKPTTYYNNARREIAPLLPQSLQRVLEIGCGAGDTLAWLQSEYNCRWAAGVELEKSAARIAAGRIDSLVEGNIETLELPFEPASFDVILCLDVLEHLCDPWKTIENLHRLLKPKGALIASIPNVTHFSVLRDLLTKNRWDYGADGVLDITHMRFFTRATAIELLTGSGLKLDTIIANGKVNNIKQRVFNLLTFGRFSYLFDYQYLLKAIN